MDEIDIERSFSCNKQELVDTVGQCVSLEEGEDQDDSCQVGNNTEQVEMVGHKRRAENVE